MMSSLLRLRSVLERVIRFKRKIVRDTTSKRELLLLLNILQLLLLVMLLLLLKMLLLLPRVLKRLELRMKRNRLLACAAASPNARCTHSKTGARIAAGGTNILRARRGGSEPAAAIRKRVIRMHAVLSRMIVRPVRVARQQRRVRQDGRRTVHDARAGRAQCAALMSG